ncbi:MAG: Ig-like domain-containing protein [Gemmataceae bacterium]
MTAEDTADAASPPAAEVGVSSPSNYNDIYAPEDNSPGVRVTGPVNLSEGANGTYGVVLKTEPTDDVTVNLAAQAGLSLSATAFTFTPGNWDTPQTVVVTAATNGTVEGYHSAVVWSATAASDDADYDEINGDTFVVGLYDADGPNALPDAALTDSGVAVTGIDVLANDYTPTGTLTVAGYTQGGGGSVSLSGGTFTYTPSSGYAGVDSFTYTVSNGLGQTATGSVNVSVEQGNRAPVLTSALADQTSSEDETVSIQLDAYDADGQQLYFGASGLPEGIFIDRLTGEIWGTLTEDAANPDGQWPLAASRTFEVTVTVQDSAGASDSATFDWTVNHVNHAPWLFHPGALVGFASGYDPESTAEYPEWLSGPTIVGAFVAHDVDGGVMLAGLTYSMSGGPAGFTIGAFSGQYNGTFLVGDVGVHEVTVTVSDGQASGSKTFTLTVLPPGVPYQPDVMPEVTLGGDDVILEGGTGTVSILGTPGRLVLLEATGPASVSPSSVTLDAQGLGSATVTPSGLSAAAGDILVNAFVMLAGAPAPVKIDAKEVSSVKVTFTEDFAQRPVPYNTLPAGSMTHDVYRVPYNGSKKLTILLSIDLRGTPHKVLVTRDRDSAGAGDVRFGDDTTGWIQRSHVTPVTGTQLTSVGSHRQLSVIAGNQAGTSFVRTSKFSVSAWPVKFRLKASATSLNKGSDSRPVTIKSNAGGQNTLSQSAFSMLVVYYFDSDSGNLSDLSKVWFGEFGQYGNAYTNPPWSVPMVRPAGFTFILPEDRTDGSAQFGSFLDVFKIPGGTLPTQDETTQLDDQWYGFRDGRAESVIPGDTSHGYQNDVAYFKITRTISKTVVGGVTKWWYTLTRTTDPGRDLVVPIP